MYIFSNGNIFHIFWWYLESENLIISRVTQCDRVSLVQERSKFLRETPWGMPMGQDDRTQPGENLYIVIKHTSEFLVIPQDLVNYLLI